MLKVEEVSYTYDGMRALTDASLAVQEGELVALLGSNGAGKTTLMRIISGLAAPASGKITFEGADIAGAPPHRIARMGLIHVPEGRKLFPEMSVAETLYLGAMPGRSAPRRRQLLHRTLERFPRLAERQRQLAGTLSGGEQQLLAIGRALMGEPRLLLLDEPTLGLAPALVEETLAVVAELRADGLTVLLVSQEVVGALEITDRAYVLENGLVVRSGPAAELADDDEMRRAYLGL
jgi:branched-chain amino acid transport system ATP-binding protein